jgi:hypothetical protein
MHQTTWNDPRHTALNVTVRAVNPTDSELANLSLTITIFTRLGSRSAYETSLGADTGNFLLGSTTPVTGPLPAHSSRTLRLPTTDLTDIARFGDTAIYPMKIELRSGDQPVATLRSPVIFLTKTPPDVPLDLTWTFVLSSPILYQPGGSFRTPWLQRQVAHGGQLRAEAQALARLVARTDAPSVDVAVAPQLVDQLLRMRRGYTVDTGTRKVQVPAGRGGAAGADAVLKDLKTVAAAPAVELSALPFASPSIPGLIRAGLTGDVPIQIRMGRDEVAAGLGRDPLADVFRPPGSHLDQQSAFELQREGVHLLLVDDHTVVQPPSALPVAQQQLGFAEPPVAPLSVGTATPLAAIAPNDGVQKLIESTLPSQDPHLAVQSILGELAAIWLEQPSVSRGVGLIVSERVGLPGYFFGPLLGAITAVPWLNPVAATSMAASHPPTADQAAGIIAPPGPSFSTNYLADLVAARDAIATYRSIITDDRTLPTRLERLVLLSEAGQFALHEETGDAFLGEVQSTLKDKLGLVAPDTHVQERTLTSRTGTIPIPIVNQTGHPVRVRVTLESSHLDFRHGRSQVVSIPGDGVTLNFAVQARTTGRFPLRVVVTTPDGRTTLSTRHFVVRSTAYNRIALVITIGAALFLMALWARRFMPWMKR